MHTQYTAGQSWHLLQWPLCSYFPLIPLAPWNVWHILQCTHATVHCIWKIIKYWLYINLSTEPKHWSKTWSSYLCSHTVSWWKGGGPFWRLMGKAWFFFFEQAQVHLVKPTGVQTCHSSVTPKVWSHLLAMATVVEDFYQRALWTTWTEKPQLLKKNVYIYTQYGDNKLREYENNSTGCTNQKMPPWKGEFRQNI